MAFIFDSVTGEILQDETDTVQGPVLPDSTPLPTCDTPPRIPRIVRGADYLSLPRSNAETWLVGSVLPAGGSMLLYGDPKVGKSFAALQLAESLATGKNWLGFPVLAPCRVVYIQLDTPRSLWADRVSLLRTSGLDTDEIYFADRETLNTWPFDILDPNHQVILAEALAEIAPDCVILDTLREAHRGDENDSTDMQNVVSHLTAVVKPAALVMVAHGKKADPSRGTSLINDNRGSNYVVGAVDAIAHMTAKGLTVGGRAIEETFLHLDRLSNGTWGLQDRDRVKKFAQELISDPALGALSLREKARILASQTDKSESAALSMLQRMAADRD